MATSEQLAEEERRARARAAELGRILLDQERERTTTQTLSERGTDDMTAIKLYSPDQAREQGRFAYEGAGSHGNSAAHSGAGAHSGAHSGHTPSRQGVHGWAWNADAAAGPVGWVKHVALRGKAPEAPERGPARHALKSPKQQAKDEQAAKKAAKSAPKPIGRLAAGKGATQEKHTLNTREREDYKALRKEQPLHQQRVIEHGQLEIAARRAGDKEEAHYQGLMKHAAQSQLDVLAQYQGRMRRAATARKAERATALQRLHAQATQHQEQHGLEGEHKIAAHKDVRPLPSDTLTAHAARTLAAHYGEHALAAVLHRYSPTQIRMLRKDFKESENVRLPGSSKAEAISYITAHLTGGRYSGNFNKEDIKAGAGKVAKGKAGKSTETAATITTHAPIIHAAAHAAAHAATHAAQEAAHTAQAAKAAATAAATAAKTARAPFGRAPKAPTVERGKVTAKLQRAPVTAKLKPLRGAFGRPLANEPDVNAPPLRARPTAPLRAPKTGKLKALTARTPPPGQPGQLAEYQQMTRLGRILLESADRTAITLYDPGQARDSHGRFSYEGGGMHQTGHEAAGHGLRGGGPIHEHNTGGSGGGGGTAGHALDEHGQQMPFTHAQWQQALAIARPVQARNPSYRNDVKFGKINGKDYVFKEVDNTTHPSHTGVVEQHKNEAATVAAMKALGMGDLVPAEAYHVVIPAQWGPNGHVTQPETHLTIQSRSEGKSFVEHGNAGEIAQHLTPTELQRAQLGEYLIGMRDRHVGNVMYQPPAGRFGSRDGHLVEIDHGHGLKETTALEQRSGTRDMWNYKRGLTGLPGGLSNQIIPAHMVREALAREADVTAAVQRFGLNARQLTALHERFEAVRQVAGAHPNGDLNIDELRQFVGYTPSAYVS